MLCSFLCAQSLCVCLPPSQLSYLIRVFMTSETCCLDTHYSLSALLARKAHHSPLPKLQVDKNGGKSTG